MSKDTLILGKKIMKRKEQIVKICGLLCCILFLLAGCGSVKHSATEEGEVTVHSATFESVATEENVEEESAETKCETAAGETTPEETLIEQEPATITLLMVGDILLHTPVEEAARQEDGTYCFDAIFENLKEEIREADLALVNQEVILGGEELGVSAETVRQMEIRAVRHLRAEINSAC